METLISDARAFLSVHGFEWYVCDSRVRDRASLYLDETTIELTIVKNNMIETYYKIDPGKIVNLLKPWTSPRLILVTDERLELDLLLARDKNLSDLPK